MKVVIEEVSVHEDHRGWVFEPMEPELIPRQRNIHVVLTQPKGVRGNHYHKKGSEVVTVMGPALARFRENGEPFDRLIPPGKVFRFTIPPEISHAFQSLGETTGVLIAFNTAVHDPEAPDVVSDILIPDGEPAR